MLRDPVFVAVKADKASISLGFMVVVNMEIITEVTLVFLAKSTAVFLFLKLSEILVFCNPVFTQQVFVSVTVFHILRSTTGISEKSAMLLLHRKT